MVKDSEESQKCVLREHRGGERRIAKGEAREMPEAEVKETVKVKLPEQQPEEIKPQEESKRLAEMSEVPKLEAEMASEQSNGKPYGEKRKDPEIPDGEIRAAVKEELSEQQSEELQPQESLMRLTMEPEITGESELISEMPRDTEKNKPRTEEMISAFEVKVAQEAETEVCGMSKVSLRLRGTQGMKSKEYKDNGEDEHLPMSEMSSEIRIQAVERTTRLPVELPSTLNVERRGACVSQITVEAAEEGEDWKQPMVSGGTEKLTKR